MSELSWVIPSFPGFFVSPSSVFLSWSEREISKLAQPSGKRSPLGKNTLILAVKYQEKPLSVWNISMRML
jgi:hypothetical protein